MGQKREVCKILDKYSAGMLLNLRADVFSRNGSVVRKQSGYYHLVWRENGKQHAVHIGKDHRLANGIATALESLKAPRKLMTKLAKLHRQQTKMEKEFRQLLTRVLGNCGYHLYGNEVRKRRVGKKSKK